MSGGSLGLGPGGLRRAQTTEEAEAEAGMASSGMAFSDESDGSDGSERHDRLPTDGSADGEGGAAVRVAFPPFLLALRPTPSALDEAELGLILDLAESLIGSFFAKEGRFGEGVQYNYLSLFGIDSQTWVEEGRSYCAPGADEEGDRQRCEEPCEYGYGSLSSCGNGRACLPNVASCPVAAAVTGGRRADDGNGNGNGASNRGRPQLRRSLQDDGEGADADGSAPKGSALLSFSGGVVNFSIEASAAREPTEALLGKMAGRVVEGRLADMLSRMVVRGESDAFPNVELSNLANIMDVSVDLLPVTETQPETQPETDTETDTETQPETAEALAGTAVPASSTSTSEIQMTAGPTLLPTLSPTLSPTVPPTAVAFPSEDFGTEAFVPLPLAPVPGSGGSTESQNDDGVLGQPVMIATVAGCATLVVAMIIFFAAVMIRRRRKRTNGQNPYDPDDSQGDDPSQAQRKRFRELDTIVEEVDENIEIEAFKEKDDDATAELSVRLSPVPIQRFDSSFDNSPPRQRSNISLDRQRSNISLDDSLAGISLDSRNASFGMALPLQQTESFEIRRFFESVTVTKDMMVPESMDEMQMQPNGDNASQYLNSALGRTPQNVDTEDRRNVITHPRGKKKKKKKTRKMLEVCDTPITEKSSEVE